MDTILHLQGNSHSDLTPLWLVHPISGLALPYLALGELSEDGERPVYGINSPIYAKKSWCLPPSLDELASTYVQLLREQMQPHGPYFLGGWSMGGMIAMRMAALLEAQNERVIHVVLIDSINPQNILPFQSTQEHENLVTLTYDRLVEKVKPASRPTLTTFHSVTSSSDSDTDDAPPSMFSYNSSTRTSSSISSANLSRWPSETDLKSLSTTHELHLSDSMLDQNYYEDDLPPAKDEECTLLEMLERMYQHTYSGLLLITNDQTLSPAMSPVSAPITLFKCTTLEKLPSTVSPSRRQAVQRNFADPKCGWEHPRLKTFPLRSAHDHVFHPEHVAETTRALRALLESCA
jgi:pimeloyl-ACP methyl ester carboxylesterase